MVDPFAIQKTLPSDTETCITSISGLVCFLVVVFFLTEQGSTRHVLRTESEVISICFVKLRRKGNVLTGLNTGKMETFLLCSHFKK